MQQFSIRDIEQLCGIKAHTLRIWEQRYQLGVSERPGGQHRVYSNEDLKEWLRIAYLYHNGHKISFIAALDKKGRGDLLQELYKKNSSDPSVIHQLTEASLDFNKELFEKIIQDVVIRSGINYCIQQIFYPYLQRIGLLWLTNHAIPAQEHFASHIIRKKIIAATDDLEPASPKSKTILVFAPQGEFHEIPLMTANYIFRKSGLRTVYFGVNVSNESLRYFLGQKTVDILYTHVITCLHTEQPADFLDELKRIFTGIIIRSGPVFSQSKSDRLNEIFIGSPMDLEVFARQLATD